MPVDYDRDGWLDLVVVNDTVRNFLFRNKGDGSFEESAIFEGIAYDRNGKSTSAMGVDAAYFRDDRELGIVVGNFANEMASLFVTNDGRPPFVDEAVLEGLGPASRIPLTFGLLFLDYDLDGRLDLLLANGHLEHEIHKVQQSQTYAQPPHCSGTAATPAAGALSRWKTAATWLGPWSGGASPMQTWTLTAIWMSSSPRTAAAPPCCATTSRPDTTGCGCGSSGGPGIPAPSAPVWSSPRTVSPATAR